MVWYPHVDFFWLFILAIILIGTVSRIFRSHQREKTIRMAIEKGVTLDPGTLHNLQSSVPDPQDSRTGLLTGAIVTFFVGCGLIAMGYILSMDGNMGAFRGLAGVGALLWCISLGLFISRLAFGRRT
jgi:hypothetical protein